MKQATKIFLITVAIFSTSSNVSTVNNLDGICRVFDQAA
jgi:hypothetical protein